MVNFLRLLTILAIVAGWLSGAPTAQAGFSLITTRTGTDSFDWSQLGPEGTPVTNPASVTSAGGVAGNVIYAAPEGGSLSRGDQPTGFAGNFKPGDNLLVGQSENSIITVGTVGVKMTAGGAQIMGVFNDRSFVAEIEALDAGGLVLATFTEIGMGNGDNNNTAIFIGVQATGVDTFSALRFSVDDRGTNFAINQFSFTPSASEPPVTATPLPPTVIAALLGMAGLGGVSFRRRSKLAPGV